jgi:hypothetical protein
MRNEIAIESDWVHANSPTGLAKVNEVSRLENARPKVRARRFEHALDFALMGLVGLAVATAGISSIIMSISR